MSYLSDISLCHPSCYPHHTRRVMDQLLPELLNVSFWIVCAVLLHYIQSLRKDMFYELDVILADLGILLVSTILSMFE